MFTDICICACVYIYVRVYMHATGQETRGQVEKYKRMREAQAFPRRDAYIGISIHLAKLTDKWRHFVARLRNLTCLHKFPGGIEEHSFITVLPTGSTIQSKK